MPASTGTSEHCIATHPSDVAVALVAFDAVVHSIGPNGARTIAIGDFYLLPGDTTALSFIGAGIILHVGIGLRWPLTLKSTGDS